MLRRVMFQKALGVLVGITAFLACPCHLPITLPLLLAVLAGTPLAGVPDQNLGLLVLVALVYLVVGLGLALRLLGRETGTKEAAGRGPGNFRPRG